jgi:hypothetical protein
MSLADVLADSASKTTTDEIERLLSKCPDVPAVSIDDLDIVVPSKDKKSIGRMVEWRYVIQDNAYILIITIDIPLSANVGCISQVYCTVM